MADNPSIRIVFMGTPEFAVASLDALCNASNIEVAAVVTVADKPAGRGQKVRMSAVKEYALSHDLPVLQPIKLKSPEFVSALEDLKADLFCVVAFRMLPEVVWSMPPKGTINLHGSLLPNYRGAAPINWAVINGETETGATTFFIEQQIDTGNVIDQARLPIGEEDTAGEVHDRMMMLGADLLVKTVQAIAQDNAPAKPQTEMMQGEMKPAPKIFREDCKVKWDQSVQHVHNFVRGMSPFPTAWTTLNGKSLKIYKGERNDTSSSHLEPGTIKVDDDQLMVACADHFYKLDTIQLEGKKRMGAADFIRGQQSLLQETIRLQ